MAADMGEVYGAKRKRNNGQAARTSGDLAVRRGSSVLQVGALFLDERADALGEQGDVERLLERLVEAVAGQRLGAGLVLVGQRDDQRLLVDGVLAQVRGDLQ